MKRNANGALKEEREKLKRKDDAEILHVVESEKTRRSSRVSKAVVSNRSTGSSSKKSTHAPEVGSDTPFSVVIYKYSQNDPIAVEFQQKLDRLPPPAVTLSVGSGNLASLPVGFEFIQHLKLGKDAVVFDDQFMVSCSCLPGASACKDGQKCDCIDDESGGFTYSRPGILRDGRNNQKPIFECHQGCHCGIDCRNRVVQRGRKVPLEIFWAGARGWGLRCPEKLPRGALIEKYYGEVIGPRESSRRARINDKKGTTYLFNLDKFDIPRAKYHAIDGEHTGGVSRFINHSCSPNLTSYSVVSDRRDCKVYDIAFFTNRVINVGEELTYDYVEAVEGDIDKDEQSLECLCGSKKCRGRIF